MTLVRRLLFLVAVSALFFCTGMVTAGIAYRAIVWITPEPLTLLDAVAQANDDAVLRMVSAGADPGLPGVP